MRIISYLTAFLLGFAIVNPSSLHAEDTPQQAETSEKRWSLVIHGGAGTISRERITQEKDAEIRAVLTRALDAGSAILEQGGSAMDAVTATIMVLENDPNFNAGKGAVFTWEGTNSLDASIMDGATRSAGAAAGISATKNPILLARAVMENSPHVLLSGEGADQFSREQALEQAEADYFATPERRRALERFKASQTSARPMLPGDADYKFGTVGAVAMDNAGNIAAGTSTGGMTGKRWGRIGDSPLIGAGTYADNRSCGISATGAGEYFIRVGVAHEICTQLRLTAESNVLALLNAAAARNEAPDPEALSALQRNPLSADEAQNIADTVIAEMGDLGGDGGIIYLTPWGHIGYSFDTPGMYRGMANSGGKKSVAIYGDE